MKGVDKMSNHKVITVTEQARNILILESKKIRKRLMGDKPCYVSASELASAIIDVLFTTFNKSSEILRYRALLVAVDAQILARLENKNYKRYYRNQKVSDK